MQPTKPVSMSREFLRRPGQLTIFFDSSQERTEARDSVAESMARLFPCHVYTREEIHARGKLLVVTYTYEYSRLKDLKNRIKSWVGKLLPTRLQST